MTFGIRVTFVLINFETIYARPRPVPYWIAKLRCLNIFLVNFQWCSTKRNNNATSAHKPFTQQIRAVFTSRKVRRMRSRKFPLDEKWNESRKKGHTDLSARSFHRRDFRLREKLNALRTFSQRSIEFNALFGQFSLIFSTRITTVWNRQWIKGLRRVFAQFPRIRSGKFRHYTYAGIAPFGVRPTVKFAFSTGFSVLFSTKSRSEDETIASGCADV